MIGDGPSNDARRVVAKYPARYVIQPPDGAYAARNRGISESRGNILVFTDSDCHHPPGWLSIIGSVLDRETCDVVVGPSHALNKDPVGLLVQAIDDARWVRLARERAGNYCDTRNLAGPRSLFLREPFDPSFQHGGDLEWGIRVSKLGCRILYVPEIAVGHENVASLAQVWRRGVRRGWGLARIREKHGRGVRITGSRSFVILGMDFKESVLETVTYPVLRPIMSIGLAAAAGSLAAFVASLLRVPALRGYARHPFEWLDRACLLLGLVASQRSRR